MFTSSSPNTLKQFWGLLTNRWAFGCFALLTLQQIIEASATIWLVGMMKSIISGEPFSLYLTLYLTSLCFPYIPGCIANIFKITWKQEAQRFFINAFVSSNRNQIGEWNNKGIKEEKLTILTAEGPSALIALIDYVFDLYSYVLSVLFNILALSIVVEPLFSIAYGLSVITVFVVMKVKKSLQRRLTKKALTARIDLYQSLLASWDNILLGNHYNFKLWEDKTSQRLNRCLQKNVALERFDQVLAIFISLLTSVPSLIVVVYYIYSNLNNIPNLSAFLVTLPVLFIILSYTYQTLSLVFRWAMHRSKLLSIYKAIEPIADSHLAMQKKVKWSKIQICHSTEAPQEAIFVISSQEPAKRKEVDVKDRDEGIALAIAEERSLTDAPLQPAGLSDEITKVAPQHHISAKGPSYISSYQELLAYTTKCGRLTLRGENGAGKSTLLMLVKHELADRAFFLPTQNQLSFIAETNKYSTGESLRNRLMEILERVDVDVLLLDEWDANLDSENHQKLSLLIDKLAESKCVIEVRHR